MPKVALITGITGQDGSYLCELLLGKGYEVHGLIRRASTFNTKRIDHLYQEPHGDCIRLKLHYGDMTDSSSLIGLISSIRPDEIYNLAAQSHVGVSFETPEYTANVDALGTLRILEAVRFLNMSSHTRIYQASTSELFGKVVESPQTEVTPFYPRSPYGVAKLYAYWITVNYREAHGMFACNGILFNHESPRRGETFVTRKITRGLARVVHGIESCLYLGNLDAKRDWGHARDFVEMQWLMLQQNEPNDYVISTGQQFSIRWFVEKCCEHVGIKVEWQGHGTEEKAVIVSSDHDYAAISVGREIVKVDARYFRPSEVQSLLGDSSRARFELGWSPKTSVSELIDEMMEHDLKMAGRVKSIGVGH